MEYHIFNTFNLEQLVPVLSNAMLSKAQSTHITFEWLLSGISARMHLESDIDGKA